MLKSVLSFEEIHKPSCGVLLSINDINTGFPQLNIRIESCWLIRLSACTPHGHSAMDESQSNSYAFTRRNRGKIPIPQPGLSVRSTNRKKHEVSLTYVNEMLVSSRASHLSLSGAESFTKISTSFRDRYSATSTWHPRLMTRMCRLIENLC